MFRIFTEEAILRKIIDSEISKPERTRSTLFRLLQMQKNVFVSSKDAAWLHTVKNESKICLDASLSAYIDGLASHSETVLQHPSSLFVLDVPILEVERLQKSYGVCCICGDCPSIATLIDTNDEYTTNNTEPLGQGWGTVLQSFRNIPSNALLLTDRYLFTNESYRMGNGIVNVKAILDVLLPQRLLCEYHVTIVFDVEKLHSDFTFNDIVERLEEVKQSLHRDYPIVMEVLGINSTCPIYMKLHNRRIVSNYYIVKVEHKLAAFNGNVATAQQSIIPQVLFTVDSLNGHSSPPLKSIEQMTATLRSFSRWTLRISDHSSYSYALNGELMDKCNGIKNRLFK